MEKQQRAEHLFREAEALYEDGDWAAASALTKELIVLSARDERYQTLGARCLEAQALAEAYDHAQEELALGRWRTAVSMLQAILARAPAYRDAESLLARAKEGLDRDLQPERLYVAGVEAAERSDWPTAIDRFEQVGALQADHRDVEPRLAQAREALAQSQI